MGAGGVVVVVTRGATVDSSGREAEEIEVTGVSFVEAGVSVERDEIVVDEGSRLTELLKVVGVVRFIGKEETDVCAIGATEVEVLRTPTVVGT